MSSSAITLNPGTAKIISRVFSNTCTGLPEPAYPCEVKLAVDRQEKTLLVEFRLSTSIYLAQNNYTTDNSPMWNQEVFELFLSAGNKTPERYLEIQVNPNGALFSAWVDNPDGKGTENTLSFFDGREKNIKTSVSREETAWQGTITIPLSILDKMHEHYRINFFRIVSVQPHEPDSSWECTPKTCNYLAWRATFSGEKPAFHVPEYFGLLHLL